MLRPLAVVLSGGLFLQAPTLAPQRSVEEDLAAGIRQVDEGDLEAAVVTLDTVVQRLKSEKGREKDLATAHLYLAMTHLGLSQWERAKGEMREAWRNNREMTLDPKRFPPRVIQLYDETRREARKAEGEVAPAPPKPAFAPAAEGKKKGGSKTALILLGVGGAAAGGVALAAGGGGGGDGTPPPTSSPPATSSITFTTVSPPSGSTIVIPAQYVSGTANDVLPKGSGVFSVGLLITSGRTEPSAWLNVYLLTGNPNSYCGQNLPDSPRWSSLVPGWRASYAVSGFQVWGLPCNVTGVRVMLVTVARMSPPSPSETIAEATFPVSWTIRK